MPKLLKNSPKSDRLVPCLICERNGFIYCDEAGCKGTGRVTPEVRLEQENELAEYLYRMG